MKGFLTWCFGPKPLRSWRLWALVALVLYTLAGFFLAPWIIREQLVSQIQENLNREASVGEVKVNPFTLSLSIRDFEIKELDGRPWLGFDRLLVNFQSSSLFRWAWTFAEIQLERPRFNLRVGPDGHLSFADLLADEAAHVESRAEPAAGSGEEPQGLPRIVIFDLSVGDGHWVIEDQSRPSAFAQDITPITFKLTEFSTLPDEEGPYTLNMRLPGGAQFSWQGSLAVAPFRSEGQIGFDGLQLETGWRYLQDQLAFVVDSGSVAGSTDYRFGLDESGIELALDQLSLTISELHLRAQSSQQREVDVPRITLNGGHLDLTHYRFSATELIFEQAQLRSVVNSQGELELLSLFVPPEFESEADAASGQDGAIEWDVSVDAIRINQFASILRNEKTQPPGETEFEQLDATISGFNLAPESRFDLMLTSVIDGDGQLSVDGAFSIFPPTLDFEVQVDTLPLLPYQTYLAEYTGLKLDEGSARFSGHLSVDQQADSLILIEGGAGLDALSLSDARSESPLIAVASLDVSGMRLGLPDEGVAIEQVSLNQFAASLLVDDEGRVNLSSALVPGDQALPVDADEEDAQSGSDEAGEIDASKEGQQSGDGFPISIGTVAFSDSEFNVVDETVEPRFRASLSDVEGRVSGLSSANLARADVDLAGAIDGYARLAIKGQINPLAEDVYTDLTVTLSGYELTSVTPYSGRYLGQKIDQGKLALDLSYRLSERELIGDNKLVFDQFGLGEKVPSEDAIGLPIGLAVALLKDANGQIDIEVPVRGNLDDPEFQIGHLVFRAIFNLITGIVTSPFNLLGNLVGGAGEELDHVQFAAGGAALSETYVERITTLGDALTQRPQLRLEIRPSFNADADGRQLAAETLATSLGADATALLAEPMSALPRLRPIADESLGAEQVAALQQSHMRVSEEGEEPVLDDAAFAGALLEALLQQNAPSDEVLRELAQARAEAVREQLMEAGITQDRVFVLEAAPSAAGEDGVKMEFTLTAQ